MPNYLRPHGLQHRFLGPLLCPRVCSDSYPLSRWWHPDISSSIAPFSSCCQSFLASGSFPMSQLFASGGQGIGVSASSSVLSMNIQDWFLLGLTTLISLQTKGLSRVFSNTTIQRHQFFLMVQVSHLYMTTGKNHSFDYMDLCQQSDGDCLMIIKTSRVIRTSNNGFLYRHTRR